MRRRMTIGPGAASMALVLVVLSLSVLGMLTLISARNAQRLSLRAAAVAEETAALDVQAERTLAQLDALAAKCAGEAQSEEDYLARIAMALPEGMTLENGRIGWREECGGRAVECAVEVAAPGEMPRLRWQAHRLVVDTEEAWS